MEKYIVLIPLLPLIGFFINILLGRAVTKDKAHSVAILAVFGSFIFSLMAFYEVTQGNILNYDVYSWVV